MKIYIVIYGEIDAPDEYYGAYSTKERAEERLKEIAIRKDYKPHNYHALVVEEFDLDKDIN